MGVRATLSRLGVAVAITVGVVGLSLAPAGAATNTTIGQAAGDVICSFTPGSANYVQVTSPSVSYTVPAGGGLITSWSIDSGTHGGTKQLELWRPLGGSNYMLVGTSPAQAIVANTGVSTYVLSTPLAARAGDLLGMNATSDAACGAALAGSQSYFSDGATPPLGSTITIAGLPIQGTLNIAATLQQGQCGAGLTAHYVSGLATGGSYDSGVFCVNYAGIGTFTLNGVTAPARIIRAGDLIWFQVMGNNLRLSGYVNTANGASSFAETKPYSVTGRVITFT